jgi:hypothetical protein
LQANNNQQHPLVVLARLLQQETSCHGSCVPLLLVGWVWEPQEQDNSSKQLGHVQEQLVLELMLGVVRFLGAAMTRALSYRHLHQQQIPSMLLHCLLHLLLLQLLLMAKDGLFLKQQCSLEHQLQPEVL